MADEKFEIRPIGVIYTPHKEPKGTPIQAKFAAGIEGTVEVDPRYSEALKDLEGFERIWLIYWFDRTAEVRLMVRPYLDTTPRGLFATRAPCRPNPIGMSCVRLLEARGNLLRIADVDILDGTPLLDIKPYTPLFDSFKVARSGWLDQVDTSQTDADERFQK